MDDQRQEERVMGGLVPWLRGCLDQDEAMHARLADSGMQGFEARDEEPWSHFGDPDRILADIAAKRAILDLHDHYVARIDAALREGRAPSVLDAEAKSQMERVVRLLASPYAAWPGYRPEWRPR